MENNPDTTVFLAIVQSQDIDSAEDALREIDIDSYRLPSVGGFLGRRNATLLIVTPPDREDQTIDILKKTCRQRIEYIAVPLESASLTLPTPTPINVGGAIVFGIDIEQFKEL